ncbi:hypothetical protein Pfo_016472 [Paulownia fortunei]|nr:hypothetical protein Pfo_016472 [Paulownia fortunei]
MALLPADDEEFAMETRDASPAHFLIKIESFSLLSEYGIQKYESKEFVAGDYKWKLIIYPDGHESENDGKHISVYLAMVGTSSLPVDWEVNAIFSFFLFNQISDKYLCFRGKVRRFHAMKPKWGFSKLISKKSLTDQSNGYLVDDNCVFGAEVFVNERQRVIECVSLLKVSVPYKRDWKISKFSKLEDVWTSEVFFSGDHHCYHSIQTHDSENDGKHISVYLAMAGTSSLPVDWEVNAIFSFFLFNHTSDKYLCFRGKMRRFHAMKPKWGFSKLISKKSLTDQSNGYLVDDNCVFGAEVFVNKSQRVIECVSLLKVSVPYKRDWKISKFSKLKHVWTSEKFSAGDHHWKIELYPNGNGRGKGRSVSIYLGCVDSKSFDSHEKVKADFSMRIKNKFRKASNWFTSSETTWGWREFIPITDMCDPCKGFIIDDCCLLEIEISVQAVVRNAAP